MLLDLAGILSPRLLLLGFLVGLECRDLFVDARNFLFDYVGQFLGATEVR